MYLNIVSATNQQLDHLILETTFDIFLSAVNQIPLTHSESIQPSVEIQGISDIPSRFFNLSELSTI
jgi:hypothetical protein